MEYRPIGSLNVSVIGLGCNNFGGRIDEAKTKEVLEAAMDAGINFFDTADIYGGTKSEEFMGRILKPHRSKFILATKFGMEVNGQPAGGSPAYIRKAVEDSLARLQIETIDLYQIHQPDSQVPIAETLGALNELIDEGKVREIGCSNFTVPMIEDAEAATLPGQSKFVSVQNHYSLCHREPEPDVVAECDKRGIALLPYFPLACGLLTGKYHAGNMPTGTRIQDGSRWISKELMDVSERLFEFASSHHRTMLELAFSWLLSKKCVASVIAGATSAEQILANSRAGSWILSKDELDEIDSIAPISLRIPD